MRSILTLLVLTCILSLLHPSPAIAQVRGGSVTGTVTDTSQAILPGATVKLDPGGLSAVSDSAGKFTISNVAPGTYTVTVDYVGFSTFTAKVTVADVQAGTVTAVLDVGSAAESILVTAERAHGEAESINEIRTAENILNILPATVIRSLPNANIADAVGRLPGVTLERDEGEGKYVQIRGTEPRLANLTVDGVEVPSPEGGVRQVKLDVIPSDLIEAVQINKTLQANQNGDAIGGSVNLVTKKAGSLPLLSLYGSGGFTPIADTRKVYEFGGTAGKRFGTQQRLGLVVSGGYDYNGRGIDDVEPVQGVIQSNPTFTPDVTSVAIRQYLYQRKRYGFGASADYRVSDTTNLYVHSLFSDFKDNGHRFEYGLNTNDDPANPNTNVPSFNTEIRNPDFQVASLSIGGTHAFSTSLISWQFAVGRARMLNPIGGGESHTNFSYTGSMSNCQYLPGTTTNPYLPQFNAACFTEAYNPANFDLTQIQQSGHGKTAQLNLEGTLSAAKNYHLGGHTSLFEAGFYFRNAHKFDDSFETDFCPNDSTTVPITLFLSPFQNNHYYASAYKLGPVASWEKVNSYLAANPGAFNSDPTLCPSAAPQGGNNNNFDLVERVTAGYLMNSIDFGNRFHLTGGVRFEGTNDRTLSCNCDINTNAGPLSVKGQGSYIDVLPSASLRIRLDGDNKSALRLVYARGLSRPDPQFLTSATTVDNSTNPPTLIIGNPSLRPEHGNNFDVLYERFLHPLGLIQAGFFYKSLSDPIVTILTPANPPTVPDQVSQARNAGSAYITGIELSFQQHFTYLPGFLSGLGVLANYSYATSKADNVNPNNRTDSPALLRQAPHTWNISPTYDRHRLSLRTGLAYNGPNIFAYAFTNGQPGGIKGPFGDIYLYSHFQVDAQGSYYLGKGLTFVASGLNLNNEVFGFYQGSRQYPIQREYYKPTYSFGFRWNINREK